MNGSLCSSPKLPVPDQHPTRSHETFITTNFVHRQLLQAFCATGTSPSLPVNLNGGEQPKSIGEPCPRASPDLVIDMGAIVGKDFPQAHRGASGCGLESGLRSSLSGSASSPRIICRRRPYQSKSRRGLQPFPDCRPVCRLRSSIKSSIWVRWLAQPRCR